MAGEKILTLRLDGGLRGSWTNSRRRHGDRGLSWRRKRSGSTLR